ncbi:MAG TPA: thioredoxin domain-containing protein [Solirubrobacteraceae bacterium]|jgi:protein-disulfide isomerase|nr:thioredoxin domain-containing protein [Solirubrobacteraceae bacterium]
MASRAEQKAAARAQRIEFERKLAEAEQRKQRLMRLAGVALVAVVVVVAAVVISSKSSGGAGPVKLNSTAANGIVTRVSGLIGGVAESGNNTLGKPSAPVQVTEYGDLECSACDDFALPTTAKTSAGATGSGVEDQLINTYVKTGKASLTYRSLDTATGQGATPQMFPVQQAAALAAGLQGKAWYYIELFYAEQGAEGTSYVNETYLDNLAKQVPGLNYSQWLSARNNSNLTAQVQSDAAAANSLNLSSTPSIVIKGPKGQAQPIQGVPTWSQLQSAITAVGG